MLSFYKRNYKIVLQKFTNVMVLKIQKIYVMFLYLHVKCKNNFLKKKDETIHFRVTR